MTDKRLARGLLLHPRNAIRSVAISRRVEACGGGLLPIIAAGATRFQLARGARLTTQGRVVFSDPSLIRADWFGEMPVGPTIVRMTSASSRLRLGAGVRVAGGTQIIIGPDAEVQIGAGTYLNPNSRILCASAISIGSGCAISWRVSFLDFIGGHGVALGDRVLEDLEPIHVGDGVLIGAGAMILRGVTIGTGAIVGAGSVITSDVAPHSLVAGNPARLIADAASWIR